MTLKKNELPLIWIRGAGDLATGIGVRLRNAGFKIIFSEIEKPTVIRRTVAFASAIYEGMTRVEGHTGVGCNSIEMVERTLIEDKIPVFTGDETLGIVYFKPIIFIESTIRKIKTEIPRDIVSYTIAIGPGFSVPEDVDAVIETMRGHYLGQVIWKGSAIPNSGIPGDIGGFTKERVIHSPVEGILRSLSQIGDTVLAGEPIAKIIMDNEEAEEIVLASITGILRGMIYDGIWVPKGFKIADIDPRCNKDHCFSISDKARSIAGGALEAVMVLILKSE